MAEQIYKVRDPAGDIREIRGPAGASDAEIIAQAQTLFSEIRQVRTPQDFAAIKADGQAVQPQQPIKIGAEGFPDAMRSVVRNESWGARNLAGAGTAAGNLYQGAKQVAGNGDDQAIQANRIIAKEAPAGAFVGNAALLAPTAMIPGANTVAGAGLIGALTSAYQPTQGDESRVKNIAVGTGLAAGGQYLGNKVGGYLTGRLAKQEAEGAAAASRNSVRDKTLADALDAGYVVPPSTVNPTWLNKRMESLAGKAATGQEVAVRNQEVTNSLIRKALNMGENEPITEAALKQIRTMAAQPYRDIAAVSKDAADALELLKAARFETNAQYKFYNRSADPAALAKAKAASGEAQGWEQLIESEAANSGKAGLVDSLKTGRQTIAKTHDIERALNTSTGNVVATDLGKMVDKGKPFTGEIETAARFGDAFPQFAREGTKVPSPGVSKSEMLSAALLSGAGFAGAGPMGVAAGVLPFLSGPARSLVLSKPYQALMAKPNYGPGLATKALGQIDSDKAGILARALFLTAQ